MWIDYTLLVLFASTGACLFMGSLKSEQNLSADAFLIQKYEFAKLAYLLNYVGDPDFAMDQCTMLFLSQNQNTALHNKSRTRLITTKCLISSLTSNE